MNDLTLHDPLLHVLLCSCRLIVSFSLPPTPPGSHYHPFRQLTSHSFPTNATPTTDPSSTAEYISEYKKGAPRLTSSLARKEDSKIQYGIVLSCCLLSLGTACYFYTLWEAFANSQTSIRTSNLPWRWHVSVTETSRPAHRALE